jgi:hypothetical protein
MESTGQVLAIFCMNCCERVGVYRTGVDYILYVLLWVGVYRTGVGFILYVLL